MVSRITLAFPRLPCSPAHALRLAGRSARLQTVRGSQRTARPQPPATLGLLRRIALRAHATLPLATPRANATTQRLPRAGPLTGRSGPLHRMPARIARLHPSPRSAYSLTDRIGPLAPHAADLVGLLALDSSSTTATAARIAMLTLIRANRGLTSVTAYFTLTASVICTFTSRACNRHVRTPADGHHLTIRLE